MTDKEPFYTYYEPNADVCHVAEKSTDRVITTFRRDPYSGVWKWARTHYVLHYGTAYCTDKYVSLEACKRAWEEAVKPKPVAVILESKAEKKKSALWPF